MFLFSVVRQKDKGSFMYQIKTISFKDMKNGKMIFVDGLDGTISSSEPCSANEHLCCKHYAKLLLSNAIALLKKNKRQQLTFVFIITYFL